MSNEPSGLGLWNICRLFTASCVVLNCVFKSSVEAGCLENKKCCPTQDNWCFVIEKRSENGYNSSTKCFCDGACLLMKDCCSDFRRACQAVDCEVTKFSEWSKCSHPCGIGVQIRRRKVNVFPQFGGNPCPKLKERRGCMGANYPNCPQQSLMQRFHELRETARILPAKFGRYRLHDKYNPKKDPLRKNLFFANPDYNINEILKRPTYCSSFEVVEASKDCQKLNTWAVVLRPGAKVCMECQPIAMYKSLGMRCKGDGVLGRSTKWNAIGVHKCRGLWKRTTKHGPCTCNTDREESFILL